MRRIGLFVVTLAACGGGGGDGDDAGGSTGGGGEGGEAPRLWERQLVVEGGDPALAVAGDVVDIVYVGQVEGVYGVGWVQLGGAPELVAETGDIDGAPAVARDGVGGVHVAWATSSGEVQYAARGGSGWTVETVATERYAPDLAVAADGTPHVAFVDRATGNGMVHHAVRTGGGWQTSAVHGTDWFGQSAAAIALDAAGQPLIAAPDGESMGVWLATADGGGGWAVEALGADRLSAGPIDVAVGAAGLAVAFKSETHAVVAWRPDGGEWTVEEAAHHDSSEQSVRVAVGASGPFVVTDVDVDYPNGLALLERGAGGWSGQLLGRNSCDGGGGVGVDTAGEPVVALTCNYTSVYFMRVIGRYPADWNAQCEAAAAEMCEPACACGTDGEQCCWGLGGSSTCTGAFGCPSNAEAALCGDPTISPAALDQCRAELPSRMCSAEGPLDLSGACGPLYQPFM